MAILTISREYGSGGMELGRMIAESLDYKYVDKDVILSDMKKFGEKWEQWGSDLDERRPSIWEKFDWSFRGFSALMKSIILGYAERDKVVIMGRGGNFLLEGIPFAFRIRVVAALEARLKRIMERESMSKDTALWLAQKTDKDRAAFIRALYGRAWAESSQYDETYDTAGQPLEVLLDVVREEILRRDALRTEPAKSDLRMRALAAKVQAGIWMDRRFLVPTLEVERDAEGLVLRGIVHSRKERQQLEEAAAALSGGVAVKSALHYRP